MKRHLFLLLFAAATLVSHAAQPLRVFIRGGAKTHGPNAHEHERFLNDWKVLLNERGIKTDGAKAWPDAEQLSNTDVLVMYAQDGGNAAPEQKENLAKFTKRGGGIVVIHTAAVSNDPAWWKSVIGGAWVQGPHPITLGAVDFKMDDEIYYNLDMSPDVRVLAESDTGDGTPKVQAQMWTYEKDNYRAFVTLPGHLYSTFQMPNYRPILLRGICWAGKRTNLDEFCKPEEIKALSDLGN
jgi:type 1 glutamine amidotransferase